MRGTGPVTHVVKRKGTSMHKILFILLALYSAVCHGGEKMKITFVLAEDGGGYVYEIDTAAIPDLPKWAPDTNDPPLTVKDALKIARNEVSGMGLEQNMKLASIRISSASGVGKDTVWYYSVTFVNDATHRNDCFMDKTINILMNGSVIEGRKISKEEYAKWFR